MTIWNYIAIAIFVVAVGSIIGITIYKKKKNKEPLLDLDSFINTYSDSIIDALRQVVHLLLVDIEDFDSQEEYERTIIETTINYIKGNAEKLGFDLSLFNLIDASILAEIFWSILNNNRMNIFTILNSRTVIEYEYIFDPQIVDAATDPEVRPMFIGAPDEFEVAITSVNCIDCTAKEPDESISVSTEEENK